MMKKLVFITFLSSLPVCLEPYSLNLYLRIGLIFNSKGRWELHAPLMKRKKEKKKGMT